MSIDDQFKDLQGDALGPDRTPQGELINCVPPGGVPQAQAEAETPAPTEVPTIEVSRYTGKTKTIIDSANYQSPLSLDFLQGNTQHTIPSLHLDVGSPFFSKTWLYAADSGMDRLRYTMYKFWTSIEDLNGEFVYVGLLPFEGRVPLTIDFSAPAVLESPESNRLLNNHYKKQTLTFRAKDGQFPNREDFVEFLSLRGQSDELSPLFDRENTFFDHSHKIETPFSERELRRIDSINKPVVERNSPEYNFYIDSYERALNEISTSGLEIEEILPNMYISLAEKNSDNLDQQNSLYNRHITLRGLIDDVYTDIDERGEKIGERDKGQYFDKWASQFGNFMDREEQFLQLSQRFKNLIIPPQEVSLMKSNNQKRFLFPMHVDIEFTTDKQTEVTEALRQSELASALMRAPTDSQFFNDTSDFHIYDQTVFSDVMIGTDQSLREEFTSSALIQNSPRPLIDLLDWWDRFSDPDLGGNSIYEQNNFVAINTNENELFQTEGENNQFARMIQSLIFSGRLEDICRNKFRSFQEVLDGKLAPSETLFYRISKHIVEASSGLPNEIPVQSFFIANSNDLDIARYIDTQVVYGRDYIYRVQAYELVFGTEYEYVNFRENNDSLAGVVDVVMRPSLKLVEIPYYEFGTVVVDDPPPPPEVEIAPFKDVSNRLLFNLSSNAGSTHAVPIALSDSDLDDIQKILESQKPENEETARYTGDDEIDFYEIFRITAEPTSYSDFEGSLYGVADSEFYGTSSSRSSSTSFIDKRVSPNVKYYYTFRAVDIHGNRSNPTNIYQAELVDDDGVVYPMIEIFRFKKPAIPPRNRSFKRYIKIEPNFDQAAVIIENESEIDSARNATVTLGRLEPNLFSPEASTQKKFKFRIISKESGKKVDINVVFKHKHTQDTDA